MDSAIFPNSSIMNQTSKFSVVCGRLAGCCFSPQPYSVKKKRVSIIYGGVYWPGDRGRVEFPLKNSLPLSGNTRAGLWSSMYWQYYCCTCSSTVPSEGAARVPVLLTIYASYTKTPHQTADTHQNPPRKSREGTHNSYRGEAGRQGGRT